MTGDSAEQESGLQKQYSLQRAQKGGGGGRQPRNTQPKHSVCQLQFVMQDSILYDGKQAQCPDLVPPMATGQACSSLPTPPPHSQHGATSLTDEVSNMP